MAFERIPLFPLEVVLFPGTTLPLHIFEPRYKTMIQNCRQSSMEFGVVLTTPEGIATVGCTAEILDIIREHPDGRTDIATVGAKAFRISEVLSELPYYEAQVEFLTDEDSYTEEDSSALLQAYEQCRLLLYGEAPEPLNPGEPVSLSYRIAADLPLELKRKQALLEMRHEGKRRAQVLRDITELLPLLRQTNLLRERAKGNGH
jgi:ATP-dependent Lon protease